MARARRFAPAPVPSPVGRLLGWSASSPARTLLLIAVSLGATGAIDYVTGYRYAFSPFYLFPVLLAASTSGMAAGLFVAATAATVWTVAQQPPGTASLHAAPMFWNALMRFGVLGAAGWLLAVLQSEAAAARRDYLTGLYNRRHFMLALETERSRSARSGRPYALLSIDIDRFKALNDSRGHAVGDEALCVVADLLARSARGMDVPARTGGDEFCLLLPEADAVVARGVAERLAAASAEAFRRRGWPIGLSVGVASAHGAAGTSAEALRQADEAMYLEKRGGPAPRSGPASPETRRRD